MSEGRLRNTEVMGAIERTLPSVSTTATSEARHRLQEGTSPRSFQTVAVEIPRSTVSTQSATSVPNVGTTRTFGNADVSNLSASLKRPTSSLAKNKSSSSKASETPANPFEGDDYDESKNPFAEDENSSNPFGEGDDYNESLNPFSE